MSKSNEVIATFTIGEKSSGGLTPPEGATRMEKLSEGVFVTRFSNHPMGDRVRLLDAEITVEVKQYQPRTAKKQDLDRMIRQALRR
jgi:hypothetical protein